MTTNHKLTRSFRTLSALVYVLDITCSIFFMLSEAYIDIIVGFYTVAIALVMLVVCTEFPNFIVVRLENSRYDFIFTFRGRYVMDVLASLFLFGMGFFGMVCGITTCFLIFGIRFVGVKQPDAFNELFRIPNDGTDRSVGDDASASYVDMGDESISRPGGSRGGSRQYEDFDPDTELSQGDFERGMR